MKIDRVHEMAECIGCGLTGHEAVLYVLAVARDEGADIEGYENIVPDECSQCNLWSGCSFDRGDHLCKARILRKEYHDARK